MEPYVLTVLELRVLDCVVDIPLEYAVCRLARLPNFAGSAIRTKVSLARSVFICV